MMIVLVLASRDCKTREKQKNPSHAVYEHRFRAKYGKKTYIWNDETTRYN